MPLHVSPSIPCMHWMVWESQGTIQKESEEEGEAGGEEGTMMGGGDRSSIGIPQRSSAMEGVAAWVFPQTRMAVWWRLISGLGEMLLGWSSSYFAPSTSPHTPSFFIT